MMMQETVYDPGTLEQVAEKNFTRVFDAFLKRGINGMKDEVAFITEDTLTWNQDKQQFDKKIKQEILMKAKQVKKKTVKKVKKTPIVKRKKAK